MIRGAVFAAALSVVVSVPLAAFAADYTFDPVHTTAEFSVTHLAITKVTGKIPVVSGSLTTGANDVPMAASVTLSAKDLDTQEADRDQELHGPGWLDVTKYPTITFVAKKIEGTAQAFTMMGDLTIHGVTQPVTLAGQFAGKVTDARGHTHRGLQRNDDDRPSAMGTKLGENDAGRRVDRRLRRRNHHQRRRDSEVAETTTAARSGDRSSSAGHCNPVRRQ